MLKMKDGLHWVDLPEELRPETPALGTVMEYQFTKKTKDFQPNGRTREIPPYEVTLPPIFKIYHNKKYIDVGIVGGYDERGNVNAGEVRQLNFRAKDLGGVLYVTPSNSEDDLALYMALELHPMVADNSNTWSDTTPKLMRKVDNVGEAKKRRAAKELRRSAESHAKGLKTIADVNRAALLLGIGLHPEEEIMRDQVENAAYNTPETYLERVNDEHGDVKAAFYNGLKLRAIFIDDATKQLKWMDNKGEIMNLVSINEREAAGEYAAFVKNEKSGAQVHKALTTILETKDRLASK